MRFFAFITARTDSNRLPQKMLLPIKGRKVIEHVIDRAKMIRGLDGIVLCTSDRPQDDVLEEIAKNEGILCFRGSLEDKLERWHGASEMCGADYILTIDADDLFFAPELCELAIEQAKQDTPDFIQGPKTLACGAFTYCFSASALKKVCEIKDSTDTEMMWVYFTDTGLFKIAELKVEDPVYHLDGVRMTLDYPEDLAFFERVFDELGTDRNTASTPNILNLLREKPEINEINYFRQAEFLDNQRKKTTLKLKE
ncbi:MAG: hypothetical protein Q7S50_04095 [bacterium]|nr:hypothetical protein [bacterium]